MVRMTCTLSAPNKCLNFIFWDGGSTSYKPLMKNKEYNSKNLSFATCRRFSGGNAQQELEKETKGARGRVHAMSVGAIVESGAPKGMSAPVAGEDDSRTRDGCVMVKGTERHGGRGT